MKLLSENLITKIKNNKIKYNKIPNKVNISKYIEHTLLKPDSTEKDLIDLCEQALNFSFYGICVSSSNVDFVKKILKDSQIKIISTISFPFGNSPTTLKIKEIQYVKDKGADEIDIVINLSKIKDNNFQYIYEEFKKISSAVQKTMKTKVILETSKLTKIEIIKAGYLCLEAGIDFLKTSTGFLGRGVSIEDIYILKSITDIFYKENNIKKNIKASGGIKSKEFAYSLISAGADRLGTSSSVQLIQDKEF